MTFLISVFGMAGRFAGDLLSSALGWAGTLLFGRIPRAHQPFVHVMMAGSFLWLAVMLGLVVPSIAGFYLAATPHPPFVDDQLLGIALLAGAVGLPLAVGFAGYLVPAEESRSKSTRLVTEVARGYLITPLLAGLLLFLAGVGIVRKMRSKRYGWSDVHVPIVSEVGRYDELVEDLLDGLHAAGLEVHSEEAPGILSAPGWLLTRVSGENVRRLRPDHLVELKGRNLRIGLYPSDIAISGTTRTRIRARAAILARLVTSPAHLTTSAEAQRIEDDLRKLAESHDGPGRRTPASLRPAFAKVDAKLLDLQIQTDEWDILYRLRLQAERDLLIGEEPGMAFPGVETDGTGSDDAPRRTDGRPARDRATADVRSSKRAPSATARR